MSSLPANQDQLLNDYEQCPVSLPMEETITSTRVEVMNQEIYPQNNYRVVSGS
jgi:hypothetical protein